eukprot:659703-Hanusia_phi.AAC.1
MHAISKSGCLRALTPAAAVMSPIPGSVILLYGTITVRRSATIRVRPRLYHRGHGDITPRPAGFDATSPPGRRMQRAPRSSAGWQDG